MGDAAQPRLRGERDQEPGRCRKHAATGARNLTQSSTRGSGSNILSGGNPQDKGKRLENCVRCEIPMKVFLVLHEARMAQGRHRKEIFFLFVSNLKK